MKKIMMSLMLIVVMSAVNTVSAQRVAKINYSTMEIIMQNGDVIGCEDVPGGAHAKPGQTLAQVQNNHWASLRRTNPVAANEERAAWSMQGAIYPKYNIYGRTTSQYRIVGATGGGYYGGGYGGYYGGGYGDGYSEGSVYGGHGAATIGNIDKSDLVLFDDGLDVGYDGNNFYFNGNPITAVTRTIEWLAGKGKKNKNLPSNVANGTTFVDANGNQYLLNNGVLVPVQARQTTRATQQVYRQQTQPTQQVRSNNNTVQQNQNTQYQIVFDSASGTYVQVPVR